MLFEQLRKQIVTTGRYVYETGLTSKYSGNISARDSESGLIAIKPSGVPWLSITEEDVVIINLEGEVVEGKRKPSIETPMHIAVYRYILEAKAVVHTHSKYGTGFAVARQPIPAVAINSVELGGEVPVTPFYTPGSKENARAIAEGLEGRKAILLAAHGVLCYGQDLEEAVYFNEIVEEVAQFTLIQKILGSDARLTPEEISIINAI
jgi:L-fuculose-phosphate aldolase